MTPAGNRTAYILLLFPVVFWGGSFVATKILVDQMPVSSIVAWRIILGVIPMALTAQFTRGWPRKLAAADLHAILPASLVLLVHWTVQFTGIQWTTATNSGWIVAAAPLSISFFAGLFLRERITGIQMAGMAVATGGLVLLVSHGALGNLDWLSNRGDWFVLASIVLWGVYTALARDVSRRHPPIGVTAIILALCGTPPAVYMIATGRAGVLLRLTGEGYAALLFLAIGSTFLALWFWQEGVARLGAARAGYFLYLLPLATTAIAVPYLGDPFGGWTAIGGALVLAGVIIAERKRKDRGRGQDTKSES
ncbi:MAG: DMT family transporter [Candidatus Eisenbacteria bacterium]